LQGTTGLADQGCGTLLAWILMLGLGPPKAGRFSSLTWARREPSVPGLFAALGIQRVPAGFAYGAGLGPNGDFPLLRPARPAPAACPTITVERSLLARSCDRGTDCARSRSRYRWLDWPGVRAGPFVMPPSARHAEPPAVASVVQLSHGGDKLVMAASLTPSRWRLGAPNLSALPKFRNVD